MKVKNIEILKCSKVPIVGTLNLCRYAWFIDKGLSSIKSMWAEKKPKNYLIFAVLKITNILDDFSTQVDPIQLKHFPLNQAAWDTSLEDQQGALLSTMKFQYFWLWSPIEVTCDSHIFGFVFYPPSPFGTLRRMVLQPARNYGVKVLLVQYENVKQVFPFPVF